MHVLHLSDACDAADGVIAPSIDVIRQWRHRGHVRRVGTDEHGLALYDLNDIIATVKRLGYPVSKPESEPPCE